MIYVNFYIVDFNVFFSWGFHAYKFLTKDLQHFRYINPISAGVLENQDTLGGVNLTPRPLNPMFDVQI